MILRIINRKKNPTRKSTTIYNFKKEKLNSDNNCVKATLVDEPRKGWK